MCSIRQPARCSRAAIRNRRGWSFKPDELAKAEELLIKVKPHLYAINSDYQPSMRATDAWMTMCWTNDGAQLNRDMPEIKFVLGKDGGEIWSDFYAIPKSAANKPAGYALLNFLMDPQNAVKEHVANGAPTTDSRVFALLPPEITGNKIVYPDEAALTPLEYVLAAAVDGAMALARDYLLLELDRATGRRGQRARVAEDHLVALTGAEDALVTNNNAAAVALAVSLAGRGGGQADQSIRDDRAVRGALGNAVHAGHAAAPGGCREMAPASRIDRHERGWSADSRCARRSPVALRYLPAVR